MNVPDFLNWMVQGIVLVALVWGGLRLVRAINAATRYVIWWTTLIGVVALPAASRILTLSLAFQAAPSQQSSGLVAILSSRSRLPIDLPAMPAGLVTGLMVAWFVIVAVSAARFLGALHVVRAIKRTSRPFEPLHEQRLRIWTSLRRRGRSARIALSNRVAVPSALGLGSTVIVLPGTLLLNVSDDELDQIIVHEYAHIQRYDDWTTLLQSLVRMLVGFHPAVRWIDRELSLEREIACDDWVVALTGARKDYAQLLTRLVSEPAGKPHMALSPGIVRCRSAISIRVTRLLDRTRSGSVRLTMAAPVAAGAMLLITPILVSMPLLSVTEQPSAMPRHDMLNVQQASRPLGPAGLVATNGLRTGETHSPGRDVMRGVLRIASAEATAVRRSFSGGGSFTRRPKPDTTRGSELASNDPSEAPEGSQVPSVSVPEPLAATPLETAGMLSTESPGALVSSLDGYRRVLPSRDSNPALWDIGAHAGVAVGDSATAAAQVTAAFFSRVAMSVAGRF